MSDRRPMLWIVMVLYHKIRFCLLVINAVKPRSMGLFISNRPNREVSTVPVCQHDFKAALPRGLVRF